jgi:hypothetical protein
MSWTITLSPAEVSPGGETEVTVQVHPAQAGVAVDIWSSGSGQDSSCQIPIGVITESAGLTDANGVFSTTYKAGLDVQADTIVGSVADNHGEILTKSAVLTVKGACNTQADRLVAEYSIAGSHTAPPCGDFQTAGSYSPFSWTQWNGGYSTGNPNEPYGLIRQSISDLVVHLQDHFNVSSG